jgi:hypothetical protein
MIPFFGCDLRLSPRYPGISKRNLVSFYTNIQNFGSKLRHMTSTLRYEGFKNYSGQRVVNTLPAYIHMTESKKNDWLRVATR